MSVHEELAPAKLTVSLKITGVRSDGYHLIDSEMVSLDICDRLTISDGDGIEIIEKYPGIGQRFEGDGAVFVPEDKSNLVCRALELVGRRAHIVLEKNIPPGAGLGGGSSDAAAILRWAHFSDCEKAGRLGADVPFCLAGGRARVRGIGEVVEKLPYVKRYFALLTPPYGVSTVDVYRQWDRLGSKVSEGFNDLEQAALYVEPRLLSWRDELGSLAGTEPTLAGSGSSWFVEIADLLRVEILRDQTEELKERFAARGALFDVAISIEEIAQEPIEFS